MRSQEIDNSLSEGNHLGPTLCFRGRPLRDTNIHDVAWLNSSGPCMSDEEWGAYNRCLLIFLSGFMIDLNGKVTEDESFLLCLNAHFESVSFKLPSLGKAASWESVLDSCDENGFASQSRSMDNDQLREGRSISVFRLAFKNNTDHAAVVNELLKHINPPPPSAGQPSEAKPT
jgi:pullulanase/glycogen debranching enzyme